MYFDVPTKQKRTISYCPLDLFLDNFWKIMSNNELLMFTGFSTCLFIRCCSSSWYLIYILSVSELWIFPPLILNSTWVTGGEMEVKISLRSFSIPHPSILISEKYSLNLQFQHLYSLANFASHLKSFRRFD